MTDRIRLAGLVVAETGAVVGLHALARLQAFGISWSEFGSWLDRTPFEEVLGAMLRLVALALAYWLLISTVASLVAAASGWRSLIRAVDWLALPPIRRLATSAVTLSLAASTVVGPLAPAFAAWGGTGSSVPMGGEVGDDGRLVPVGSSESVDVAGGDEVLLPPHLGRTPSPPPARAEPTLRDGTMTHTVIVRRGDHMWSLAEVHLAQVTGRDDLGQDEVARYWLRVIAENRSRIKSGNPDLIYPGEALVLPPVEG